MNDHTRWWARPAAQTTPEALLPQALPAGTLLGPLRIERPIARGASAVLYLATDVDTLVPVAVKALCLPDAAHEDPAVAESFLDQARRASDLQHPHIVRVYGGGQVRGVAFVAMEFLPGSSLARWTAAGRRLPEAAVLEIAAQLAEALAHAHRQGIVHRDVKPANVIYDPAVRRAVLTDFGLARAPDAQATRSGQLLGSPAYMAPELLAGAAPDARSDLYALGVLCYELLAGRPPFEAAGMGALLRAIANDAPPPLALLRPELEAATALDALLAPLLAKAPDERAADGAEWARQARLQQLWLSAPPAS
jgi:eukaryotic-like serine/threonine-protein kinase